MAHRQPQQQPQQRQRQQQRRSHSPANSTSTAYDESFLLASTTSRRRGSPPREDECTDWSPLFSATRPSHSRPAHHHPYMDGPQAQIQYLQRRLREQETTITQLQTQVQDTKREYAARVRSDLARARQYFQSDLDLAQLQFSQDLERARKQYKSDLAIARKFYWADVERTRAHRESSYHGHLTTLRTLIDVVIHRPQANTEAPQPPLLPSQLPSPPSLDQVLLQKPTVITHALTSVRVVGDAKLPGCVDVLSLISSFIPSVPLDVAVGQGAVHMTKWLLANGATPTPHTAHVAVCSGSVAIVEAVFGEMEHVEIPPELFQQLAVYQSESIAQWLLEKYPVAMAKEFVRLSSLETRCSESQYAWYAHRICHQWQWEEDFEQQCEQRKRRRLESGGFIRSSQGT